MNKFQRWMGLTGIVIILALAPVALATGEFQVDYDVAYSISPSGQTLVTQNISLTNNLTNLYPQQYSILLDSDKIKNVIAYDQRGALTPKLTQKDGQTEIVLSFSDAEAGLGKKNNFSLRFENGDIAQKVGSVWEVNIPGVVDSPDLASYFVSLQVPTIFGPNAYVSPLPGSGRRWTKEQMVRGGISAAYGDRQVFLLELSYYLENPGLTPRRTEIALPPDTSYQKVLIESLEPAPKTVLRDPDGNWLAQYDLGPNQKIDLAAKLIVTTFLKPRQDFARDDADNPVYLKPTRFWQATDPQIVALAKQYTTARQIYDFVVSSLSYDYNRVNQAPLRKGALLALAEPKNAICMEFTDLFIAIARAAGIPAREVVGYAHTTNTRLRPLSLRADVLHAWPEYYDSQRELWVPVDPTWANTTQGVNYFDKLDFNHITFAIHGREDDYPYPAGFYKKTGQTSKDVLVRLAEVAPTIPKANLVAKFVFPKTVPAGIPTRGYLEVTNPTGVAADDVVIMLQSTPTNLAFTREEAHLPPFTAVQLPFTFNVSDYRLNTQGYLTATIDGQSVQYAFSVRPMYWLILPLLIASGFIIFALRQLLSKWHLWSNSRPR